MFSTQKGGVRGDWAARLLSYILQSRSTEGGIGKWSQLKRATLVRIAQTCTIMLLKLLRACGVVKRADPQGQSGPEHTHPKTLAPKIPCGRASPQNALSPTTVCFVRIIVQDCAVALPRTPFVMVRTAAIDTSVYRLAVAADQLLPPRVPP